MSTTLERARAVASEVVGSVAKSVTAKYATFEAVRTDVAGTLAAFAETETAALTAKLAEVERERDEWHGRAVERDEECDRRARKQWDAEAERDALAADLEKLTDAFEWLADEITVFRILRHHKWRARMDIARGFAGIAAEALASIKSKEDGV